MSIDRWMDKEDVEYIYIHTHNGILLSHKKNKIMPFATTWMIIILSDTRFSDTKPRDYHTKWSKSDKVKYDITYRSNLKNDTNELICKTEIDSDIKNKLRVTKGEGRME